MSNTFYCEKCDYSTKIKCNFQKHCASKRCRERGGKKISYRCDKCNYETDHKGKYEKHLSSMKCRSGLNRSQTAHIQKLNENCWDFRNQSLIGFRLNGDCRQFKAYRAQLATQLKDLKVKHWAYYDYFVKNVFCARKIRVSNIHNIIESWKTNLNENPFYVNEKKTFIKKH